MATTAIVVRTMANEIFPVNILEASLPRDCNGNGVVDQLDDDLWKSRFGEVAGARSGSAELALGDPRGAHSAAVPEPASSILAAIVLFCGIFFANRTTRR